MLLICFFHTRTNGTLQGTRQIISVIYPSYTYLNHTIRQYELSFLSSYQHRRNAETESFRLKGLFKNHKTIRLGKCIKISIKY